MCERVRTSVMFILLSVQERFTLFILVNIDMERESATGSEIKGTSSKPVTTVLEKDFPYFEEHSSDFLFYLGTGSEEIPHKWGISGKKKVRVIQNNNKKCG